MTHDILHIKPYILYMKNNLHYILHIKHYLSPTTYCILNITYSILHIIYHISDTCIVHFVLILYIKYFISYMVKNISYINISYRMYKYQNVTYYMFYINIKNRIQI